MLETELYLSEADKSEAKPIDAPTVCATGSRILYRLVWIYGTPHCQIDNVFFMNEEDCYFSNVI